MCEMDTLILQETVAQEGSCGCSEEQHVHEITGSTKTAECGDECHNHRFATVSGVAMPCRGSHVHNVEFRTDSHEGHFHEFCGTSSTAFWVGNGKHVHFASARTTPADRHTHEFQVASLIDDPTDD